NIIINEYILSLMSYMTINTRDTNHTLCPFSDNCTLPQMEMLCSYPECKVCPEYQIRENSMKMRK
ncbi:MAG: hypothetical protein R6W84_16090, partial [Promethearchaeia archaeon]